MALALMTVASYAQMSGVKGVVVSREGREAVGGVKVVVEGTQYEATTTEAGEFVFDNLPAGEYTSVKIKIGNAEGQNWWCVLFPPLCTSFAVSSDESDYVDVGLSKDQYNMITGSNGSYKVKFKLLEIAAGALGVKY